MKLGKCEVTNFGSYKHLEFDFSNQGLTLVHGATGSGKSTLQDIPAWILFGQTAKDGNVDEVRSWQAPGEPTKGTIEVLTPEGPLTVTRIRGRSNENDLYWQTLDGEVQRGKDINESQKRLASILRVDALVYTLGAYYHEFSPAGSFFTATAKARRALLDNVFTSVLPNLLSSRSISDKKHHKDAVGRLQRNYDGANGALSYARQQLERSTVDFNNWAKVQSERRSRREQQAQAWEVKKEQEIEAVLKEIEVTKGRLRAGEISGKSVAVLLSQARCTKCGGLDSAVSKQIDEIKEAQFKNERLKDKEEGLLDRLQALTESQNPHLLNAEDEDQANPHGAIMERAGADTEKYSKMCEEALVQLSGAKDRLSALEQLQDLSSELRAALLAHAVSSIQSDTNRHLERHFDSEIRVKFTLTDADNLDVEVSKNGYECVYRQLSKGQRGLLKLCFAVSIKQAACNKAGVTFDTLFYDEALDGLDASNKVKAFGLFEELSKDHGTIVVIDHSTELQAMFDKRYLVSLNGDFSEIEADE